MLIGAATTLVIIVAVFLAYNANNGLPFVPTYQLKAEVPERGEPRAAATRCASAARASASSTTSRRAACANGRTVAELSLKLETVVQPLPDDSTILVRPRSALGLKYVEITKGNVAEGFEAGATVPLARATPRPVEIDEVFSTFDERHAPASRTNLLEFGNALAGRGKDLNEAFGVLPGCCATSSR